MSIKIGAWRFTPGQMLIFLSDNLWVADRKAPAASFMHDCDLVMDQNPSWRSESSGSTSICLWCEQHIFASCLNQWEVTTGSSDGLSPSVSQISLWTLVTRLDFRLWLGRLSLEPEDLRLPSVPRCSVGRAGLDGQKLCHRLGWLSGGGYFLLCVTGQCNWIGWSIKSTQLDKRYYSFNETEIGSSSKCVAANLSWTDQ